MSLELSPDEYAFLADALALRATLQDLYDESRHLAQSSRWEDHLRVALAMVPGLVLLEMADWLARIYGRMAWDYIRLGNDDRALLLLTFSERHDAWQAAANYYWAAEYSQRSRNPSLGTRCMAHFRRLAVELGIDEAQVGGDLALAVRFYEALVLREHAHASFREANNQSDLGRYLELRARLYQQPDDFDQAATHYDLAGLAPYAAGCRVFARLTEARREQDAAIRLSLYERAVDAMREAPIFADEVIRDLLTAHLETRLLACEVAQLSERLPTEPLLAARIEARYAAIYSAFAPSAIAEGVGMLAAKIPSLSMTRAWRDLSAFALNLAHGDPTADSTVPAGLNRLLDRAEKYLPSLSFLIAPEEGEPNGDHTP